ncbi:MAG: hypothetical protein EP340_08085 [Alphaproteobacteria bacterium]|nr:MAG: hypothetical protein EP340_08085 [Alphaproteobacteria bacterium]
MTKMELPEFSDLLEMYGSLLADWPEADFARASLLLEESEAARARLQETVAFEVELDSFAVPEPSRALRDNILAQAEVVLKSSQASKSKSDRRKMSALLLEGLGQMMRPMAAPALATWLLVAALGVASGVALNSPQGAEDQILAYFGGESDLWVDGLVLDNEPQNGSGI